MDHWAGSNALQRLAHFRAGLLGNLMDRPDDGPNAQFQLMQRSQIPLDGPYEPPSLFPQGHYQACQVDPQALAAHGQTFQRVLGPPPFPAQWTGPGYPLHLRPVKPWLGFGHLGYHCPYNLLHIPAGQTGALLPQAGQGRFYHGFHLSVRWAGLLSGRSPGGRLYRLFHILQDQAGVHRRGLDQFPLHNLLQL